MQVSGFKMGAVALVLAAAASPASAQNRGAAFPELVTGEQIYKGICQGCHMPDAKGASGAGAYPALAGNPKLGSAAYPIMVVVNGQKAMPDFGGVLNNDQIAAVVGYIRTNFGNRYSDKVAPADVAAMRPPG